MAPNPHAVTQELDLRFLINAMAHAKDLIFDAKALAAEKGLSRADTA
jgi:hypothetical protein